MARLPPLALYVHLPWCVAKCPYCDFNSHELRADLPERAYIDALLEDFEQELPHAAGRPLASIYLGGGTPSLFSAPAVERLLNGIAARLPVAADAEITLEANPGTVERDDFAAYREAGINRVSLGVQSFDDGALRRLGRIHRADEAHEAIASLRRAGIENFNIDLMYGLPEQTPAGARRDVRIALAAAPAHVSHYQLTLEPNTRFAAHPPRLPDEDSSWRMQEEAGELLAGAGFEHYELSGWSRPGRASRHNLNYWRFGDYLGIGAGAHGKVTESPRGPVRRRVRTRHPRRYLAGPRVCEDLRVAPQDVVFEFFLNALRLRAGFSKALFEARTGQTWSQAAAGLAEARNRGLLEETGGMIRPSPLGWRFVNDLQALFLPEDRSRGA
jgi:oxygen-independent coproporphyrinogen-3 oxidase